MTVIKSPVTSKMEKDKRIEEEIEINDILETDTFIKKTTI
jgi:hypothetical protein